MMKTTISRLVAAMAIVLLITYGTWGFRKSVESQTCALPWWDIDDFPEEFGKWKGQDVELDPKIFEATGAECAVNRSYHDDMGSKLAVHLALYKKPGNGLDHQPPYCYRAGGWLEKGVVPMSLQDAGGKNFDICAGRWKKDGKSVLVAYWFQLDKHVVFNRFDMGLARLDMRKVEVWPSLVKVLLEISTEGPDEDTEQLERVAQEIFDWTNREEPAPAEPPPPR